MYQRIKKIFQPLKEKLQFTPPGVDLQHIDRAFADYFQQMAILRSWLPYCSYNEATQTFINRASKGFILELTPLVGSSEQTNEILASIFTDMLPEGTNVQFLLIGSHKIGTQLNHFIHARKGGDAIFQWLAQKRSDYYQQGTLKSLFAHQQMILRNFRLLMVVSLPEKHPDCSSGAMSQMQIRLQSTLKSIQLYSKPLAINDFITLMRQFTAPSQSSHTEHYHWQPLTLLSNQLTHLNYEWYHQSDSLRCSNHQGENK